MEPIVINNPSPELLKLAEKLRKIQMENRKKLREKMNFFKSSKNYLRYYSYMPTFDDELDDFLRYD